MGPTSEPVKTAACPQSRVADRPKLFGLKKQAEKLSALCTPEKTRSPARISWPYFAALLFATLLAVRLCCPSSSVAIESSTPQTTEYPQADIFEQERNQDLARERQEQFRKRVPIAEAVSDNVLATPSHEEGIVEPKQSLPVSSAKHTRRLILSAAFLLTVILCFRRFAPQIADYLNRRSNLWAASPILAFENATKVRSEDDAFAEFLSTFRTGPSNSGISLPDEASSEHADPLAEFFSKMPDSLRALQKLLRETAATASDSLRQKMLLDLQRKVRSMQSKAGNLPQLLPVWQLTSALDGLLRQITDKIRHINPSTLRTVGGALDLLEDLCRPGLKANLLAEPPLKFLAVDDDLISRNAVAFALKKAFNQPDLAENGDAALALAAKQAYDVIFLDVQMPGMDGFEVCTKIHETVANRTTPVVFVTCHSDFESRAQSTLSGGSDLIGKPFLTFEITVKALTLAMRGRLEGRPDASSVSSEIKDSVSSSMDAPQTDQPDSSVAEFTDNLAESESLGRTIEEAESLATFAESPEQAGEEAFLSRASKQIATLRKLIQTIVLQVNDENVRQEMLVDFYLRLHAVSSTVESASTHPAMQMCAALEGLFKKFLEDPKNCTPSALLTVARSVDLLDDLCADGVRADMGTNPPIRMLVVDDDPVARRAMTCALQTTFEKPESVEGGEAALVSTSERPFDVIFMDVQMPGMDGFEVCTKIRAADRNRATPVVFVTRHDNFMTSAQNRANDAGEIIGKPFLTAEVTVKAFTLALRGRLQRHKSVNS